METPNTSHWGPGANHEIDDTDYNWARENVTDPPVWFYDRNSPGVIYRGTMDDVHLLAQHGGDHEWWTQSEPEIGDNVTVIVNGTPEQWPVERPNFSRP